VSIDILFAGSTMFSSYSPNRVAERCPWPLFATDHAYHAFSQELGFGCEEGSLWRMYSEAKPLDRLLGFLYGPETQTFNLISNFLFDWSTYGWRIVTIPDMGNAQPRKPREADDVIKNKEPLAQIVAGGVVDVERLPSHFNHPAVQLNDEQKKIILETWKVLEQDIGSVGIIVFIK
jgi:hypothetical protein